MIDFPNSPTTGQVFTSGALSWTWDGAKWTGKNTVTNPRYLVACSVPGVMTASQHLLYYNISKAISFPANFGSYLGHSSEAGGSVNATASTVITVAKALAASPNTFSSVGTITFAAGTVTPTFATSGGAVISFAQGDVLRIVGPAGADATFADFYATLVGYET